jgi:hypothetical protein
MNTFYAKPRRESSSANSAEQQPKPPEPKSNVVALRGPDTKRPAKFVAGEKTRYAAPSTKPSEGMAPDDYVGTCKGARFTQKGKKKFAQLLHEITEGKYAGTQLRQWEEIKAIGKIIGDRTVYYEQCLIALGGQVTPGQSLNPEDVFVGKTFVLRVGYSHTDAQGHNDAKNTQMKKYERDFLRVHAILDVL